MKILVVDPSQKLVDLDGEPIKSESRGIQTPLTIGRAIALVLLVAKNSNDPLRHYTLARKFADVGTAKIELDDADSDFVKNIVKQNGVEAGMNNLVIGQVLQILESSKDS